MLEEVAIEGRRIQEACGVFGVHKVEDPASLSYYGLHSLQHRGQESAGIVSADGQNLLSHKGKGLVNEVFDKEKLEQLNANAWQAVGHTRYATQGANITENIQPLMVRSHQGDFALVHNGQIVNAQSLRYQLEGAGAIFQGTSDTEIILHLIQRQEGNFLSKITQAVRQLRGSFSLIIMTKNTMYAVRDAWGLRPLSVGRIAEGWVIASETCAFEIVNAKFWRDVAPGEILKLGKLGHESSYFAQNERKALCAMEYVYFARPDTELEGLNVHAVRKKTGELIARHDDVAADLVIGVPDSSLSAAMGYAEARQIPYELGLIKNKYIGRTFIEPTQRERDRGVKMKLSAVAAIVRAKRCVIVDDSIVRGTTSSRIVKLIREAGAAEIHLRIVSPPLLKPCYYGIDLKDESQLISARLDPTALAEYLACDSVKFLSIEDLCQATGGEICCACFNGAYPLGIS